MAATVLGRSIQNISNIDNQSGWYWIDITVVQLRLFLDRYRWTGPQRDFWELLFDLFSIFFCGFIILYWFLFVVVFFYFVTIKEKYSAFLFALKLCFALCLFKRNATTFFLFAFASVCQLISCYELCPNVSNLNIKTYWC